MYLLIDPSEKNKIRIIGFTEDKVETKFFDKPNRDILFCIDSFLSTQALDKKDVQGIAVVVGIGGFTSTRIATTVANAWHLIQHIPVLAISLADTTVPQPLIQKFNASNAQNYVLAQYSGEPNIGKI